ncbi:MAG TPA: acyltransferase [Pyrinomonadaceae bacterium]|jgi:acetyltransferase-like isoleucine patch superfamily enzyme
MFYRELRPQPQAEADFDEFLDSLYRALTDGQQNPNDVVRDTLYEIYYGAGKFGEGIGRAPSLSNLSPTARAVIHNFDPRNITTEPEYYTDIDGKAYQERKPFIWLWQMYDRSPLGQNAFLGHRFRRMLAPLIFRSVGENFKCWHFVEWSYGYNLSFGDNVVVHRHVLLDDRGGIEIGNNVSISDYANIYSHTHDINDIHTVYNRTTRIGDGARITYHATVLAGTQVGAHSMVATGAVATKDVEPYHIKVGIPARTVKVKENPDAPTDVDDGEDLKTVSDR